MSTWGFSVGLQISGDFPFGEFHIQSHYVTVMLYVCSTISVQ